MKKILFIALLAISHSLSAQGNLQFNQVILVTLDGSTPYAFTVPANKVWKIESSGSYVSSTVYLRDNAANNLATLYSNTTNYRANFPFWLPSGFSGDFYREGNVGSGPKASVSILEFNVIP